MSFILVVFLCVYFEYIIICKNDREKIIDDKKQKIKDYQKEYRKNITNEQKQKYKNNQNERRKNMTDEQKQKNKRLSKTI